MMLASVSCSSNLTTVVMLIECLQVQGLLSYRPRPPCGFARDKNHQGYVGAGIVQLPKISLTCAKIHGPPVILAPVILSTNVSRDSSN